MSVDVVQDRVSYILPQCLQCNVCPCANNIVYTLFEDVGTLLHIFVSVLDSFRALRIMGKCICRHLFPTNDCSRSQTSSHGRKNNFLLSSFSPFSTCLFF